MPKPKTRGDGILVSKRKSKFGITQFEIKGQASEFQYESEIVRIFAQQAREVLSDAVLVGTEVELGSGKRADLLMLKENAKLCILEFKRDDASREIFAQVLEYATLVWNMYQPELDDLFRHHTRLNFEEFYLQSFKCDTHKYPPPATELYLFARHFSHSDHLLASFLNHVGKQRITLIKWSVVEAHKTTGKVVVEFEFELEPGEPLVKENDLFPDNVWFCRLKESEAWQWNVPKDKSHWNLPGEIVSALNQTVAAGPVYLLLYLDEKGYVAFGRLDSLPSATALGESQTATGISVPVATEFALDSASACFSRDWQQPPPIAGPEVCQVGKVTSPMTYAHVLWELRRRSKRRRRTQVAAQLPEEIKRLKSDATPAVKS